MSIVLRRLVSKKKKRYQDDDGFDLDLTCTSPLCSHTCVRTQTFIRFTQRHFSTGPCGLSVTAAATGVQLDS